MNEYKVGEFFTIGKETFKTVLSDATCNNCDMYYRLCDFTLCAHFTRTDRNSVNFILYDSEE